MMKNFLKKNKGFTLIELLIVIAIIGVLSTLLMANFIGVRQRARDAQRKSDLRQIQSALELYRSDQGAYPNALAACGTGVSLSSGSTIYMQKLPCDPSTGSVYPYALTATGYTLYACLENGNDSQLDSSNNATCHTAGTYSYTVQNP